MQDTSTKFEQEVGGETIRGELHGSVARADLVYVHGAGKGPAKRSVLHFPLMPQFISRGISVADFHFSGSGDSSGNIESSSLQKRFEEARAIIAEHGNLENLTVSAASMGGEIALRLLDQFPIKNLILFCPAIYDRRAYGLQFNAGFTEAIRKPESWKNSVAPEVLRDFRGKLVIVSGDHDEVIPKGVNEFLSESALRAIKKQTIILKDCPHAIVGWLEARPEESDKLADKILNFLYE